MKRLKNSLRMGLCLAVLLVTAACDGTDSAKQPATVSAEADAPIVPAFKCVDQSGAPFERADLDGKVWIADFIFTRCTTACPILTSQMVLLQRSLADSDVHFLSFSVDPEFDSPSVLNEYRKLWDPEGSKWTLLNTGSPESVANIAEGFSVAVQRTNDPENAIIHSNRFVLIDAAGHIVGRYDSTDKTALGELINHARTLAESKNTITPSKAIAFGGEQLFTSLGCNACHTKPQIAPPLSGIAGSMVKLTDGTAVLADDRYIRESILNPQTQVTTGYGATMPSYEGHLSEAELSSLVDYIKSLRASPTTRTTAVPLAEQVDLICDMTVQPNQSTPQATYDGKTYYFCSDFCAERFKRNPTKWIPASPSGTTRPSTLPTVQP